MERRCINQIKLEEYQSIIPVPFSLLSFPCGVAAAYPLAVVVLHGLEPSRFVFITIAYNFLGETQ
jgi:hypothetical protein